MAKEGSAMNTQHESNDIAAAIAELGAGKTWMVMGIASDVRACLDSTSDSRPFIVKIDFPLPVKSIAIRVRALAVIRGISDNAQINEIERTLIEMERERRMMDQALQEVEA
jgi:hypothetical protein